MKCVVCGKDNLEIAKFCKYCGTKIEKQEVISEVPNIFEVPQEKVEPITLASNNKSSESNIEVPIEQQTESLELLIVEPVFDVIEEQPETNVIEPITDEIVQDDALIPESNIDLIKEEPVMELTDQTIEDVKEETTVKETEPIITENIVSPTKNLNPKLMLYLLISTSVVAFLAVVLLVFTLSKKNVKQPEDNDNKIQAYNIEMTIPNNITYKINDSKLVFSSVDGLWEAIIVGTKKSYNEEISSLDKIKNSLLLYSYKIEKEEVKEINEKARYVFEITKNDQNYIIAYTPSPEGNNLIVQLYNKNNTFDYVSLEKIIKIIDESTTKTGNALISDFRFIQNVKDK